MKYFMEYNTEIDENTENRTDCATTAETQPQTTAPEVSSRENEILPVTGLALRQLCLMMSRREEKYYMN